MGALNGGVLRDVIDVGLCRGHDRPQDARPEHRIAPPGGMQAGAHGIAAVRDAVAVAVGHHARGAAVAVGLERQRSGAADQAGAETAFPDRVGDQRRQQRIALALADRVVVDQPHPDELVAPRPRGLDAALQPVHLGDVVVQQIGRVAGHLSGDVQPEPARQAKATLDLGIAARLCGADIVARQGTFQRNLPGGEGLTIAQFQRARLFRRQERRHRQVTAGTKADEIGHLQPGPQARGRDQFRDQETGGARQVGVGHPQARDPEHRQPAKAQLRTVKVDLLFLRVMDDAPRPDLPQRRRIAGADLAGRRDRAPQPRIAPADAHHLGRGQLQLPVQDQPRRGQDAVGQIG